MAQVIASYGHVRDLLAKPGSVQPDLDFSMQWYTPAAARQRVQDIAKAVKAAETLILATDPDREGEAIAWHLYEQLKVCQRQHIMLRVLVILTELQENLQRG